MAEYDWPTIRAKACEWFGDTPSKPTELAIVTVFRERPRAVIVVLQEVAGLVAAGEAKSGWGLARHRIGRLRAVQAVATDERESEVALERALTWVRRVGHEYPVESEIVDELFGDRGVLRWWPELQPAVVEEWRRWQTA